MFWGSNWLMQSLVHLKVGYPLAEGWKEKSSVWGLRVATSKAQKELVRSSCLGLRKRLTVCGVRIALVKK